ncbi:MAG: MerR family transcriptional regulator [Clostridia bacterium]|nr:MerR family transcriptional regulator [Clostridia bacterium]
MRKISEFAKLCGTSPKTLRFYEKVGLLKASYTNSENGYRYYNDEQESQYKLITVFKEIGFTLDEIKNKIIPADNMRILEILQQKEAELQKVLKICEEQIAYYEGKQKNISDDGKRSLILQRYDTERKIVVSDGIVTRTFICPYDRMDICTEAIRELFCVPEYVNLSLSDIPATEEDQTVLVQVLEGTREEILSADFGTLFDDSAHISDISTVLMAIKFYKKTDIDDIQMIVSKCLSPFSENCPALWGTSFDYTDENQVKIYIIGIY